MNITQPSSIQTPLEEHRSVHRHRSLRRGFGAVVVIVLMLGGLLPRFASYADGWAIVQAVSGPEVVLLFGLACSSMASFWLVTVASLPGLSFRGAAIVKQASTATANTLPAGGAFAVGVTYTILTSWRFGAGPIVRSVLVTGVWNNLVKFGMPLIAMLLAIPLTGGLTPHRMIAAAAGVAALVVTVGAIVALVRSDRLARAAGAVLGFVVDGVRRMFGASVIGSWKDRGSQFRVDSGQLLEHRWRLLTVTTVAAQLSLFFVLLAAVRVVGIDSEAVAAIQVLIVFAFARLLTALPLTPGAVGVAEVSYVVGLSLIGSGLNAEILAAVVLFRLATWLFPTVVGFIALAGWSLAGGTRRRPSQAVAGSG